VAGALPPAAAAAAAAAAPVAPAATAPRAAAAAAAAGWTWTRGGLTCRCPPSSRSWSGCATPASHRHVRTCFMRAASAAPCLLPCLLPALVLRVFLCLPHGPPTSPHTHTHTQTHTHTHTHTHTSRCARTHARTAPHTRARARPRSRPLLWLTSWTASSSGSRTPSARWPLPFATGEAHSAWKRGRAWGRGCVLASVEAPHRTPSAPRGSCWAAVTQLPTASCHTRPRAPRPMRR
jgi:hypothetical protein